MRRAIVTGVVLCLAATVGGARADVAAQAPASLEAVATWVRFDVVNYRFELVEHREATASADGTTTGFDASSGGTARAFLELCDQHGCEVGQTWEADLGSGLTGGAVIVRDPALQQARFRGWLRDVDTGSPCEFDVTWTAVGAPVLVPVTEPGTGIRYTLSRDATVSVSAACWATGSGDPAFEQGVGSLVAERSLTAAI